MSFFFQLFLQSSTFLLCLSWHFDRGCVFEFRSEKFTDVANGCKYTFVVSVFSFFNKNSGDSLCTNCKNRKKREKKRKQKKKQTNKRRKKKSDLCCETVVKSTWIETKVLEQFCFTPTPQSKRDFEVLYCDLFAVAAKCAWKLATLERLYQGHDSTDYVKDLRDSCSDDGHSALHVPHGTLHHLHQVCCL